ncbi:MAG: hypothetical protein HY465_04380 [Deltaproteobacteria bacterium]|nr:hypothetical protein [Deltaproteobacteria bacterium]
MSTLVRTLTNADSVERQHIATKSVAIRNRRIRRVVVILSAVGAVLMAVVWTRIEVLRLGYEVTRLHRDVAELLEQKASLEVEIGRLKSPDRLLRVAAERFGMRLPRGEEIIYDAAK